MPRASRPLKEGITVVAAVLADAEGRVLVQERPSSKPAAGFWEFPGGKVERGEAPEAALARELREELGLDLDGPVRWAPELPIRPAGTGGRSRLLWARPASWSGVPRPREGQALAWLPPADLLRLRLLPADLPIVARLLLPPRLALTPPGGGAPEDLAARLDALFRNGTGGVLVRLPGAEERREIAWRLRRSAERHGAVFLVHGDEGLARETGAHGLHLPARALGGRGPLPSGLLVGASVHDAREIRRALARGVHYLVLGPVAPTRSHPGGETLGWEGFAALARGLPLPVYAIGGLRFDDLDAARAAGAHGVAVLGGCDWP